MVGKEGVDAGEQIVVASRVGPDDDIAIIVGLQIGDLEQQGDGVVAGGEAFGLSASAGAGSTSRWRALAAAIGV